MSNFREMGMFLTKSALLLSLSACGGGNAGEVNASSFENATPVPQRVLLGCRQVNFGDTAFGIALEMDGSANSTITINGGEEKNVIEAGILPLNEQHGIKPEVCIYEVK